MTIDDLTIIISFAFIAYAIYMGLNRIAEAIESHARRNINVKVGPLPTFHVMHE